MAAGTVCSPWVTHHLIVVVVAVIIKSSTIFIINITSFAVYTDLIEFPLSAILLLLLLLMNMIKVS